MRTQIIPVIHHADDGQAMRNAVRAFDAGCDGVMLIEMQGRNERILGVAAEIARRWYDRLVGINLLGVEPARAMGIAIDLGLRATWTDEQPTHSVTGVEDEQRVLSGLARTFGQTLFCGVAFKHQAHEPDPAAAARRAVELGLVPTTSGPATGVAAEVDAITALRRAIGPEAPLAIASGITPENAAGFATHLSHILVSTGVSSSFHEFDKEKLHALRKRVDETARRQV